MGLGVIRSAPRAFLVKTARKCVLRVKMVTTVSPSMASVRTVTLAGLGTGVRCAAPMAHMARTVKTTAVIVLMASVMLLPESASVTPGFMAHTAI